MPNFQSIQSGYQIFILELNSHQMSLSLPLTIVLVAMSHIIQTLFVFSPGYGAAKVLTLSCGNAAPAAMIGASNHFEAAIATLVMLFGLNSGAALATVVGILISVQAMLILVGIWRSLGLVQLRSCFCLIASCESRI